MGARRFGYFPLEVSSCSLLGAKRERPACRRALVLCGAQCSGGRRGFGKFASQGFGQPSSKLIWQVFVVPLLYDFVFWRTAKEYIFLLFISAGGREVLDFCERAINSAGVTHWWLCRFVLTNSCRGQASFPTRATLKWDSCFFFFFPSFFQGRKAVPFLASP